MILKAGQVSFHDVYMIHGSLANHTDHRRAAFIIRLMPATSVYDHALGAEIGKRHPAQGYGVRPLYLISGQDRAGNNFKIGARLIICHHAAAPEFEPASATLRVFGDS